MKHGAIHLLRVAFISVAALLFSGCTFHTINGLHLDRLGESQPQACPQIDGYFLPLGEKLYDRGDEMYDTARGQLPGVHLLFLLTATHDFIGDRGMQWSDVSLSEPVRVRATSTEIELTFVTINQEKIVVELPVEFSSLEYRGYHGEQALYYCKDGQLLITYDYMSTHPEAYSKHRNAIVFQMKEGALAVYTRQYKRNHGMIPFAPFIPVWSTSVHQSGYLFQAVP